MHDSMKKLQSTTTITTEGKKSLSGRGEIKMRKVEQRGKSFADISYIYPTCMAVKH
jgi:hypothetical protein